MELLLFIFISIIFLIVTFIFCCIKYDIEKQKRQLDHDLYDIIEELDKRGL